MRVGDGEEDMYFVFSLPHFRPAFCVLGFGYLLSSIVFLAEVLVKRIAKWGNCEVDWGSKGTEIWTENIDSPDMVQHSETNFCDSNYADMKDRIILIRRIKYT